MTKKQSGMKLLAAVAVLLTSWIAPSLGGGLADSENIPTKSVLIYSRPSTHWLCLPWLLYDPLIVSKAKLRVDVKPIPAKQALAPDLSKAVLSSYDLVIVTAPHQVKAAYGADLLEYLDRGGALLLVQPKWETGELAQAIGQRTGIAFHGYSHDTAAFSLLGNSPGARILGLPKGRSVYPHPPFAPHLQMTLAQGHVLTRLSEGGDPDIVASSQTKLAIFATDAEADVSRYHRGDPEFADYQRDLGYLFVNEVRYLLGYGFFDQPVQRPQRPWSEMFYAYAAGRQYVAAVEQVPRFAQRLPAAELSPVLDRADQCVVEAARCLVQGDFDGCRRLHRQGVELLSQAAERMVHIDRYLIHGLHESICFDDYYGGGVLGYAEPEWLDLLMHVVDQEIDLVRRSGSRRLLDFYGHDWEVIAKYYPDEIQRIRAAIHDGLLEPVHGLYSAAYLPIYSAETNVRQLQHGLELYRRLFGCEVVTYANPWDHFDFHPQIPQLLKAFGLKYAILHNHMGSGEAVGDTAAQNASRISWRGLDGTQIEAVPVYAGLAAPLDITNVSAVAKAEELGYRNVLLGNIFDAPSQWMPNQAHSLLDPIAPIAGTWVTGKEYFEKTPPAEKSIFLGVDELRADRLDYWSGWGCMNENFAKNRETENLILAAEKFSAAATLGEPHLRKLPAEAEKRLTAAWKGLMATQDHMLAGTTDYSQQILPPTAKLPVKRLTEHTWGYGFAPMPAGVLGVGGMENYGEAGSPNYAGPMVAKSRCEKARELFDAAQANAREVLSAALDSITGARPNATTATAASAVPVCVFNPLGWPKKDVVVLDKEFPPGYANDIAISDGRRDLPYQVLAKDMYPGGSLKRLSALILADIPPLGYKTYLLRPGKGLSAADPTLKATATRLENGFYEVLLDERHGGIRRLFDKPLQTELARGSEHCLNELYSPETPRVTSQDSTATIELVEEGPLRATTVVRSRIGELPCQCAISLYRDLRRIDFRWTIDYGHGCNFGTLNKEGTGLFVLFPIGEYDRLYVNRPFAICQTQRDRLVTPDFVDACQGEQGLAVIHGSTPAWHVDKGLLAALLTRGRPLVVGRQTYQFSIYPHSGNVHRGEVFRTAQEVNTPLLVSWPKSARAPQPQEASFLEIDRPNIVLSTICSQGNAVCARFYEIAGQPTRARISLPVLVSGEAQRIDLSGNRLAAVPLRDHAMQIDFKPWEIVTVRLGEPREVVSLPPSR